jgi:cytosine/adenosine deaminase-related metal-dependent hydrolase
MILYTASWVLPVTAPPLRSGVVAVDDERIAYVGTRTGAPRGELRDLGEVILMPGLVNAHTHLELTSLRGMLEQSEFHLWIRALLSAKQECLDPARMMAAARRGIAEGLLAGVTTYGDTCDSGVALEAMISMGVRGIMYQEVFGPDVAQVADSISALRAKLDNLLPRATSLVRVGISPHAPYSVSAPLFTAAGKLAAETSLPLAIHIAESQAEMDFVRAG